MAAAPVPTHDAKGNPLTRDGHVIQVGLSPFSEDKWVVYIYPNHTDMRHSWEPACPGVQTENSWEQVQCDLRVGHNSSHAHNSRVSSQCTYAYDIPEMENIDA